jgi:hypothetical protein
MSNEKEGRAGIVSLILSILFTGTALFAAYHMSAVKGRGRQKWVVGAFFFSWIAVAILALMPGTGQKRTSLGQDAAIAIGSCFLVLTFAMWWLGAFDVALIQNGVGLTSHPCYWFQDPPRSPKVYACTGPLSTSKPSPAQQERIDELATKN